MKLYLTKTPKIVQELYKNYTWCFGRDKKEIYLTFDDGPTSEITPWVLDTLKAYNAKATFFCIGKNIVKHPKIFQQIIEEKHAIGNHTNNHLKGFKTPVKEYIENTLRAEKTIRSSTLKTQHSKLFRPPYGKLKSRQAKKLRGLDYKIIMWDVLSADFDISISKEKCLQNVLKNTQNGSIIVFHDSIKASEKLQFALPKVLEYYTKKEFVFKAIS